MLKRFFSILIILLIFFVFNQNESYEFINTYIYNKPIYNYFMKIEIPKISLSRFIYNDERNNIEQNVSFHELSNMPNVENGNLILMAHSGDSIISFFKDLNKLNINDSIYIFYDNYKYEYVIDNMYEIKKAGKALIKRKNLSTLTLITCIENNKQIIIICYLKNKILLPN